VKKKIIVAAVVAALSLSVIGCGNGVNEKRLVELTGQKNFEQIKQAWQNSILQEKPEDAKVYAYWLEKNGKIAEPTFNADAFEESFMMKYNKGIEETKQKMQKMKSSVDTEIANAKKHGYREVNWNIARALRNEKRMASFAAFSSAFVRDTYIPFLSKLLDKLDKANKELKRR